MFGSNESRLGLKIVQSLAQFKWAWLQPWSEVTQKQTKAWHVLATTVHLCLSCNPRGQIIMRYFILNFYYLFVLIDLKEVPFKGQSFDRLHRGLSGEDQTSVNPIPWIHWSFFKLYMPFCPVYMSSPIRFHYLTCLALMYLHCFHVILIWHHKQAAAQS